MKITKKMINEAEEIHFQKEDLPSLVKLNALSSLYYKQKGDLKTSKEFITGIEVKKMVNKIQKAK